MGQLLRNQVMNWRNQARKGLQTEISSGLISIVQTLIFRNGIGSDYAIHEDTNDNELLGLPEENLDSVLADIISRLE